MGHLWASGRVACVIRTFAGLSLANGKRLLFPQGVHEPAQERALGGGVWPMNSSKAA
jgi:hypothetical protein